MKKILAIGLLLALSTNSPIIAQNTSAGIVLAIINKQDPTEKLNPAEVKDYWMRRGPTKKWKVSSDLVLPLDRKTMCPEKDLFYTKVLTLGVEDVEAYFAAKQYQSAEAPPEKLATDKDGIDYVISHPRGDRVCEQELAGRKSGCSRESGLRDCAVNNQPLVTLVS